MNHTYLITGGNIGDRKKNLNIAAESIEKNIGHILKSSAIYETAAWGDTNQPAFFNQVHLVETLLSPEMVMQSILEIEKRLGRVRTTKNAARIIDIDILFYNDQIIENSILVVPHKEIAHRKFVLKPLVELAPDYIHPALKKSISQLDAETTDYLDVWPVDLQNRK
ncbi:MAG: 2-amino-4-hydroxy-6-hydroxymethyldihydropteridine diphosphokinase [Ginsengibacter sp.]